MSPEFIQELNQILSNTILSIAVSVDSTVKAYFHLSEVQNLLAEWSYRKENIKTEIIDTTICSMGRSGIIVLKSVN